MTAERESETMYGLAFETSSALGSVALGRGEVVLEAQTFDRPRLHAVAFLPTVEQICRGHGVKPTAIRRVFVSNGPGSFTGLRIGVTAGRTIAFATGANLVAVCTLEAIAQNAAELDPPPDRLAVLLDAKRQRVYAATFVRQGDRYHRTNEPTEAEPAAYLAQQDRSCVLMGEGVPYHRAVVDASGLRVLPESIFRPRAETVYRLGVSLADAGRFTDRRRLVPVYIRPPEAEEIWNRRHADKLK